MTSTLYTIDTVEDDQGVERPNEVLWAPAGKDATDHDFINHRGLYLAGVGKEGELPDAFVALGHGHTWTAMYEAATEYMRRCFGWRDLHSDPLEEPSTVTCRTPLPVRKHVVFIRHPHPAHPCGCEWEGQWRMVDVPEGEPGAIAITSMRRPGGAR
ncbi:hypothetical protein [Streptomyces albireticuli]|uniref:Uncharacterized protein n=1 Tax=Streptomyces albireticuli TaxID=1940 RepID=A0A2A2D7C0_9ACTN|nr:hypothetical protein [Streptomyces albireticuli]MCD9194248.1 hypothetical protein [Streptomyces albireticuli]PAU47391.1 hypothetical protein CK936_19100 [Streptomyces albireticuli]